MKAIGTQLRDPINSGLTRWRMAVSRMDATAELGRNPVSKHHISLGMEMSRLTRDGTVNPVSRDQILRHVRGQENIRFPVQLTTSRIGDLTRLIHTLLYVMATHEQNILIKPLHIAQLSTMAEQFNSFFLTQVSFNGSVLRIFQYCAVTSSNNT